MLFFEPECIYIVRYRDRRRHSRLRKVRKRPFHLHFRLIWVFGPNRHLQLGFQNWL